MSVGGEPTSNSNPSTFWQVGDIPRLIQLLTKKSVMELKARQVLKIKQISTGNKYKVDEGHPFHGQEYNVYQYNGIAFTVNASDEFVNWRNAGKLFSVDFTEGTRQREVDGQMVDVPTIQLVGCTNIDQEVAMAKTESTLAKIYRDAETTVVTDDVIADLLK